MSSFNVSDSAIAVQISMEKTIESVLTMLADQDLNVDQEAYPLLSASQKEFLCLKGIVSKTETEKVHSEASDDSWVEDGLNDSTNTAVEAEEERPDSVMIAIEPEEEEEEKEDLSSENVEKASYMLWKRLPTVLEADRSIHDAILWFKSEVKRIAADEQKKKERSLRKMFRFSDMTEAEFLDEAERRRAALLGSSSEAKISDHCECCDKSDFESDEDEEETESETKSESDSEEETDSEESNSEEESDESKDEEEKEKYEEEEAELEQEDTLTAEAETTQAATSEAPEAPKTTTDRWVDELSNMKNLKTSDQSSMLERMMAEMKKAWF